MNEIIVEKIIDPKKRTNRNYVSTEQCSVNGCLNTVQVKKRSLCLMHNRRFLRYDSVYLKQMHRVSDVDVKKYESYMFYLRSG